ncbi:MAG: hypothetical protein OXC30_05365 [Alphaproteobacteria bacterium]|nr:hypothetical protein [Alphaproteobacteria bacterium]
MQILKSFLYVLVLGAQALWSADSSWDELLQSAESYCEQTVQIRSQIVSGQPVERDLISNLLSQIESLSVIESKILIGENDSVQKMYADCSALLQRVKTIKSMLSQLAQVAGIYLNSGFGEEVRNKNEKI